MCHVWSINLSQICGLYARWTHLIICWRKAAKRKMNKNLANLAAIDEAQFCFFLFLEIEILVFLIGSAEKLSCRHLNRRYRKNIYSNNHQEQDCVECKVHILFFLRSSFNRFCGLYALLLFFRVFFFIELRNDFGHFCWVFWFFLAYVFFLWFLFVYL